MRDIKLTKKEIISLILLIVVVGYGAWNWINRSYSETKRDLDLLDTVVTISATSKSKDIGTQIDSVFAYIRTFEDIFDDYNPQSWVYKVNNSQGKRYPMNPDAYELLCVADSLYQLTDGAFDITIKPLYDLWGFSKINEYGADTLNLAPPDSMLIKETLKNIGFNRIRYNKQYIKIPQGMQITFGALAKGYALEKAREYMENHKFISGIIDCTSGMTFFGHKHYQIVSIKHPRANAGMQTIGNFKIKNGSLSTSGDYQLYFEHNGKRYHHILNPFTGYPVENIYSVTVIYPSATLADGLSTAMFLLPPNQAIEALKHYPGSNAVIFYQENSQIVSLKTLGMKELDWHDEQ